MRKFQIILTLFIAIGAAGGAIMMWVDPSGNLYFVFGLVEAITAIICLKKK